MGGQTKSFPKYKPSIFILFSPLHLSMDKEDKKNLDQEKKKDANKDKVELNENIEEDDDDFEDFEIDDWDESKENKIDIKQWQEDWDDEDVEDEFTNQLRKELGVGK